MTSKWEINGKTFLITGGASGLGAAYAESFLEHGAKKVAIVDIDQKAGEQLSEKLNRIYTDKVVFIKCDVSKENEVQTAFEQSLKSLGLIDVIINNAGVMDDSPNKWRTATDVNWQGLISLTMKGVSHMRKDEGGAGGTIINISSAAALIPMPMLPIYSGSKAAVLQLSRSIASPDFNEDTGIRILTLCPGATETPLLSNLGDKFFDTKVSEKTYAKAPPPNTQSVRAVVEAMVKMYREGAAGSIWLSLYDKPGKDVTASMDAAYKQMEQLIWTDEMSD
ncbi:unnamed protein product [Danaus chrysippus]|uniref:15-hydroxyprostaglandin dehydrogenase [NAD(+)] n=1 Tax=Danaus chrysippus TaxID=151541 RepID=A0A8J2W089_9NEOP|nr:unnamed protein product [Danaus chrysippus]